MQRPPEYHTPSLTRSTRVEVTQEKSLQSEGLWRPVRNTGESNVWGFAGGLSDSCKECKSSGRLLLVPTNGCAICSRAVNGMLGTW